MRGSLALSNGIVYVVRHARVAEVRSYDLDGAPQGVRFEIGQLGGSIGDRADAEGIAVDRDRRLWIADAASGAVRAFTVFGVEIAVVPGREPGEADQRGSIGRPVAVAVDGVEDEMRLLVASAGERRHALQLFDRGGEWLASLRSRGDPQEQFRGLVRVAQRGRFAYACESGTGLVQVFRDGEFHCAFAVPQNPRAAERLVPRAVAPLADGRLVVASSAEHGGALDLLDAGGRPLARLAGAGTGSGEVFEPTDVVVDEGEADRRSRVVVIDQDGDRVQVFTLEGLCYGSFADLPRAGA